MELLVFVGLVLVGAVIVGVIQGLAKNQKVSNFRNNISADYSVEDLFVSPNDLSFMGFNFNEETFFVGTELAQFNYDFDRIASVEVLENNSTINQTNRGSQILGAAIGGAAFGVAGAMVGGLTGSSRSNNRLKSLSINIIVDDPGAPIHKVSFFKSIEAKGSNPEAILATQARTELDRYHALLLNAMRIAERNAKRDKSDQPASAGEDTLGTLERLASLRDTNAITAEEYDELKTNTMKKAGAPSQSIGAHNPSPQLFTVILEDLGQKKIQVLQRMTELLPGMSLENAVATAKKLPAELQSGLTESQASRLQDSLAQLGARTSRT